MRMEPLWVDPQPTLPDGQLTAAQEEQWRQQGYALVQGLFPAPLITQAATSLKALYAGEAGEAQRAKKDFGGFSFPFERDLATLNEISLHPRLLAVVHRLLQTRDVRLSQSDAWAKVSGAFFSPPRRVGVDGPACSLRRPQVMRRRGPTTKTNVCTLMHGTTCSWHLPSGIVPSASHSLCISRTMMKRAGGQRLFRDEAPTTPCTRPTRTF